MIILITTTMLRVMPIGVLKRKPRRSLRAATAVTGRTKIRITCENEVLGPRLSFVIRCRQIYCRLRF